MSRGVWLKENPKIAKLIGSKGGKNGKRGAELWTILYDKNSILIKFNGTNSKLYREIYHYKTYKQIRDLTYNLYGIYIPKHSKEFRTMYGSFARFKKENGILLTNEREIEWKSQK